MTRGFHTLALLVVPLVAEAGDLVLTDLKAQNAVQLSATVFAGRLRFDSSFAA